MIRTRARLAAAGLVAVATLTGCGDGAVRLGAAAVVGDARITADTLQERVETALENDVAEERFGADRAEFQRQQLSRLVTAALVEEAARRENVRITEGQVDVRLAEFATQAGGREALEQQGAESGVPVSQLRAFIRELVLQEQLGDKLVADIEIPPDQLRALYEQNLGEFDRVRAAHILVADRATAQRVLTEVEAEPGRFPALAQELSTDQSSAVNGGALGVQGRGAFVPEFEDAVFNADPGSFVLVQTQFGFHVVHVQERLITTFAEATSQLRRIALQEERGARLQQLLTEVAEDEGVRINPRFGKWDLATLEVTARDTDLSTPAGAPSEAAQPGEELLPEDGELQGEPADPEAPAPAEPEATTAP